MARSSGSDTGRRNASAAPSPRANRDAFSSFVASRRPTLICAGSKARSVPGRPFAAQYRTASEPFCVSRPIGVTTLPLDLDIFLRSGSRIHPDSTVVCHGSAPFSKYARTTEENNQVRMIS